MNQASAGALVATSDLGWISIIDLGSFSAPLDQTGAATTLQVYGWNN